MDALLEILLRLLCWPFRLLWLPYRLALENAGNSRIGTAPAEAQGIRFWRTFAIIGTCVLGAAIAGAFGWAGWFLWH